MNCPSRADPEPRDESWNQNPSDLAADVTTRADLDQRASRRLQRGHKLTDHDPEMDDWGGEATRDEPHGISRAVAVGGSHGVKEEENVEEGLGNSLATPRRNSTNLSSRRRLPSFEFARLFSKIRRVVTKYVKFIGPGFMVAVAYIDPGNYATDVAAGASFRFALLFMVLVSNLFAIFLQSLCVKLGSVTGMNLAENCKAHLPGWLNYVLWFFAESAIIATDIAEVIGAAIALNLLNENIPLVAGCAISIADVLVILIFYKPGGTMRALRAFEIFIIALVLGVVICFCIELSLVKNTGVGEVFRGYLPSSAIVQSKGLYQACGILGATVMPHSLYLGSGIVQARLHDFDTKNGSTSPETAAVDSTDEAKYRPSLSAINACLRYSTIELAVSLFTFALFVNSAILIVAGSSLSNTPAASADLFGIHNLLSSTLSPAAGALFAVALLLSGMSAGIVCTMAGQMVSEGQLNLQMPPWARRLFTRSLSIVPSIVIAGSVGAEGLSAALEGSQVALSVILPFVSAPLIWFTCRERYMRVDVSEGRVVRSQEGDTDGGPRNHADAHARNGEGGNGTPEELAMERRDSVSMQNHWITASVAVVIWLIIVVMNGALIVLAAMGID